MAYYTSHWLQLPYMLATWHSEHNQLQQAARRSVIFCDQCGACASYCDMPQLDTSVIGRIRHSCGGRLKISQTTTLNQFQRGLTPEEQAVLDEEVASWVNRVQAARIEEDKDHIKKACHILELLHNCTANQELSIRNSLGAPQLEPLNFPDAFPSCPYCKSKWIGPKPRLTSIFGIPVPKWLYPTPEPPRFCFNCRSIVS